MPPPPPPPPECNTKTLRADFSKLQALSLDSIGRLHILDTFEGVAVILDASTGELMNLYAGFGEGPGLLRSPVDVLLIEGNRVLVTESGNDEIEVFEIP